MSVAARTVRVLRNVDVRDLVSWAAAIDAIEESYRQLGDGHWVMSPRENLRSPRTRTSLKVLPALLPEHGVAGVSMYTGGNRNADAALQKCTLLFDTADGGLRAIVECDRLSWLRTGASGAVATRHLARRGAARLGILGTGRQARAQLLAHLEVMDVAESVVFSRRLEQRRAFAEEMSATAGVRVRAVDSVEEVVAAADVLCTVTTSKTPLFAGDSVRPGTHVNALGSHYPAQREVDTALVLRSRVFVDDQARALEEEGEILLPIEEGVMTADAIAGTLGEVVAGRTPGRQSDDEVTFFTSGGLSSEHLAIVELAYRLALEVDAGVKVSFPADREAPFAPVEVPVRAEQPGRVPVDAAG